MRFVVGGMMIIFFLSGLALIRHALNAFLLRRRQKRRLLKTVGTITDVVTKRTYETRQDSNSRHRQQVRIQNYPVIEFVNQLGETITFQSETGDTREQSEFKVGAEIGVYYDPSGELNPLIDSWMALWGEPLFTGLGGLAFIFGSTLIWFAFGDQIMGL